MRLVWSIGPSRLDVQLEQFPPVVDVGVWPRLSILAAEVFRFVSNGREFGPSHCHVGGPMSRLAQCHSAGLTTRKKNEENWCPHTFCFFPTSLCGVLVFYSVSRSSLSSSLSAASLSHTHNFVTPSFTHNFVTHIFVTHKFVTQLFVTHNFVTHHLSHPPSFTHNFVTHHLSHITLSQFEKRWLREVVALRSGDLRKRWLREVVTWGSDNFGKWWLRDVVTYRSGDFGKWWWLSEMVTLRSGDWLTGVVT